MQLKQSRRSDWRLEIEWSEIGNVIFGDLK